MKWTDVENRWILKRDWFSTGFLSTKTRTWVSSNMGGRERGRMSWPNVVAGLLAAGRCRPSWVRHSSVGSGGGRQRISAIIRPGASPSESLLLLPHVASRRYTKVVYQWWTPFRFLSSPPPTLFFFQSFEFVCIFVPFYTVEFLISRRYGSSRLALVSDESHTSWTHSPTLLTHLC